MVREREQTASEKALPIRQASRYFTCLLIKIVLFILEVASRTSDWSPNKSAPPDNYLAG